MEALKAQELEDDEIDEIVQQLWHQGFKSDARLMRDVQDCWDERALVKRLVSFGLKGAKASSLAFAVQTIRRPVALARQPGPHDPST